MTNYYVYYRVHASRAPTLRKEIEDLLAAVERTCGIRGRWMRRRDDPATYLEIYEGVADDAAFEAMLERLSAGLGLDRRIERFICA